MDAVWPPNWHDSKSNRTCFDRDISFEVGGDLSADMIWFLLQSDIRNTRVFKMFMDDAEKYSNRIYIICIEKLFNNSSKEILRLANNSYSIRQ